MVPKFNNTDYMRKIRAERKAQGLCNCGRQPTPPYKLCDEHRKQPRVLQRKYRAERASRGDCTKCGVGLNVDSRNRQCPDCIRSSLTTQNNHLANGQCRCGHPRKEGLNRFSKPYRTCQRCLDRGKRQPQDGQETAQ